jgi:hypothetical protein
MKSIDILSLLLLVSGLLLLTGCSPQSSIVLSNDAALKHLNEMVSNVPVRVTTRDSTYTGDNIIITRDSTILENISTKPKVIPYLSMKVINYTTQSPPLNGFIILKNNEQIEAQNINIANNDTVIRFDEVITTSRILPTKSLIKIQKKNHLAGTISGLGIGTMGGIVLGAILGTFVGHVDDVGDGRPDGTGQGFSRLDIFGFSTCIGGFFGSIMGATIGSGLGQWEDIDILTNEVNNP